jgi:hypothetical protein
LFLATVSRYLTALTKEEKKKNKERFVSVTILLGCVYLEITDFTVRGLAIFLLNIESGFLIFLSPLALIVLSFLLGRIERRWIRYYGFERPINEPIFIDIGASIGATYVLVIYPYVRIFGPIFSAVIISSFILFFLTLQFITYLIEIRDSLDILEHLF